MTNYSARGNNFDLDVAYECKGRGGLVASRRHVGGAGDLLVVWTDPDLAISLIECKTFKRSPYDNFRKADRQAMREEAVRFDGRLSLWLVCRRVGSSEIQWIHEDEWPEARKAAA